ncbi:MAG: hypothetical protein QM820_28425 [Minicystis sp.]
MNDDENTARGGFGPPRAAPPPGVRTTAPVGTPVDPAAARVPSDRPLAGSGAAPVGPIGSPPAPNLGVSPTRTVGGHTARLKAGDVEAAMPSLEPEPIATISRTVGGTMRMAPAPSLSPADAQPAAPQGAVASSPVHVTASTEPQPLRPAPAAAAPTIAAPPVAAPPDPVDGHAWSSPLAVAVGLVFFAVGSMIALAADGRLAGRAPAAAVSSAATAAVAAPPPKVAPTVNVAPEPATSASAVVSASATASAAPAAPANAATQPRPQGASQGRQPPHSPSQPPHKPGTSTTSRPALPF